MPAWIDPEHVLEMLENRVVTTRGWCLTQVALAQLETDPAAAIATIEADWAPPLVPGVSSPSSRRCLMSDRARRNELLNRALIGDPHIADLATTLTILGHIADGWLEMDALDRGDADHPQRAGDHRKLPQDQFYFEAEEFAEVLAVLDLATARAIMRRRKGRPNISPTDSVTISRHLTEAAIRLAAINPAEAERLVPDSLPGY